MKKNNRKLSIVNIIEEGRIGGPQKRILSVASSMTEMANTTIIFPKNNSKELQAYCKFYKIKYFTLPLTTPQKNLTNLLRYFIYFPFEILVLFFFFKKNEFDIIHVSGGSWQFKGVLAAKLAQKKVVWELNDTYVPAYIRFFFFFLSHLADAFIFASNRTKKYYKDLIPKNKKNFLIQSPVDTNYFDPEKKYPTDRDYIKILKKKIVVGTVANVSPVKNLICLIKTAQHLNFFSNKIVFIVVGSIYKNQKKHYKDLVNLIRKLKIKNFFFLGSRRDIRPILKKIDIYVCCSKNESSPLSVWEAMSMKKAIISTDVGDVAKFISHEVNGLLFTKSNAAILGDGIKKLLINSKLRLKFGKLSRKIAKKKLDLKICSNLHIKTYRSIING